VIHPSGTFDYVGLVPEVGGFPWILELHTDADRRDPTLPSLAGSQAWLEVREAGLTPNAGYDRGTWRPAVLRARLSIGADRWSESARRIGHFHIDLTLVQALRPRDALHVSRTSCGGLAVSAIRNHQLVFAVGAVTAVPMGDGSFVRVPQGPIEKAEALLKHLDQRFELPELPLEVVLEGQRHLLPGGGHDFLEYEVRAFQGFIRGIPGIDESAAISRRGLCSDSGANASAQLLAADGFSFTSEQ
jgi:hypothetical protein